MSSLAEHARRVPPAAVVGGVLVLAGAWWLAIHLRGDAEAELPEWQRDGQPPDHIAAGPWANFAAAASPGINGACDGRSLGATVRVYADDLLGSSASIIGEC